MDNDSAVRLFEAHRKMKHDIMNHFQVISGYLQINAPEKAMEYIFNVFSSLKVYDPLSKLDLVCLHANLFWFLCQGNLDKETFSLKISGKTDVWQDLDEELTTIIMDVLKSVQKEIYDGIIKCHIHFHNNIDTKIEIILLGELKSEITYMMESFALHSHLFSISCTHNEENDISINIKRKPCAV